MPDHVHAIIMPHEQTRSTGLVPFQARGFSPFGI